MRGFLLLVACVSCGARTELATPPDASSPVVDASHDVVAALDVESSPAPTVLAKVDVGAYAIAVDDANVYWTQGYWAPSDAAAFPVAMQCAKTNCLTPTALAMGVDVPLSIAVDRDDVYWSSGGVQFNGSTVAGLHACAIGGCGLAPETIVPDIVHGVVTQADRLFWIDASDVTRCVAADCAESTTTVAPGTGTVRIDGSDAYWSTSTAIMRCPLGQTGCSAPPAVVVPDAPSPGGSLIDSYRTFAIDSTNVYWLSHGEVRRCPKEGCATPITVMPDFHTAAQSIATDGVNVYWTAPNALVRCPVTGCAKPIPVYVSYGVNAPNCVALDGTNVYWTTGGPSAVSPTPGSVMTLPKP